MPFFVYLIQSKSSGKIYIGQTSNINLRLKRHNGELPDNLKSYTRLNKGPWVLKYLEVQETRKNAIAREKYLKTHKGRDWLKAKLTE